MCKLRLTCKSAIVILIWNGFSALATVYDSDGSAAGVQRIHDTLAVDGDTITLPTGTFTWMTGVTLTKGITLQGDTTTSNAGQREGAADDQTIILDDTPRSGSNSHLVKTNTTEPVRVTGITFRYGTTTESSGTGAILLTSPSLNPSMRVDNCHFDGLHRRCLEKFGWIYGVFDHNVLDIPVGHEQSFYFADPIWGGEMNGNGSWADYPYYGSGKFFFVETNTIRGQLQSISGMIDAMNGGRFVTRFNYFLDCYISGHGTESGIQRGQRCYQSYGNTIEHTGPWSAAQQRSGSSIHHDNTFVGPSPGNGVLGVLAIYREGQRAALWDWANGTNPWDLNYPELFDNGSATATGTNTTLIDTTKNWTPNQWVGFIVKNTTDGQGGLIQSNTATQLTYHANAYNMPLVFNTGEAYEIRRIDRALDQCGSGKGDLIRGNPPLNTTTGTRSWNHAQLEPCMAWNNIVTSTGQFLGYRNWFHASAVENRDYYNLGGGYPAFTVPSQVQALYPASVNGEALYDHEFVYPHPLVGGEPTPTPTPTPAPTPTPEPTPSPTPSVTPTATPTVTPTPSVTPSPTPTPSPTATPTVTPTPTPTATSTPSVTPSPTPSPTPTPAPDCTVPNFIGIRLNRAQSLWNAAGFTTTVQVIGPGGRQITWQSLSPGYFGSCSSTTITVSNVPQ
jgi:hypothetical protein